MLYNAAMSFYDRTPSNSDDIIDVRNLIDRLEELRDQHTIRIVAGWNMPGYLPDSEPDEFSSWDDAFQSIIDEMQRYAEQLEDSDSDDDKQEAEQLRAEAARLGALLTTDDIEQYATINSGYGNYIGKYYYFANENGTMGLDDDEAKELKDIEKFLDEIKGYGGDHQWEGSWYPSTLVRESYFTEYAEQLAEDIGAINSNASWPNNCIDWEKAARELKMDYSSADFDGVTYWYRSA